MKHRIVIFILMCFYGLNAQTQGVQGVSLSLLNENTTFPFTGDVNIHPGGEIGVTVFELTKNKSIINLNVTIGGFHHKYIANALYLKGEFQYRLMLKSILTFDIIGSIGYLHTFYPGEVYKLDQPTGNYKRTTQYGRPHFLSSIGVGVTFIKGKKVNPFFNQELAFETPFANGMPIMIHSIFKMGIYYRFNG